MSAQDTLEEATALLTGLTTQDVFDDLEQSNGDTSQEGSEVNTSSQKEGEENEDMQQEESTTNYDDVDNWDDEKIFEKWTLHLMDEREKNEDENISRDAVSDEMKQFQDNWAKITAETR